MNKNSQNLFRLKTHTHIQQHSHIATAAPVRVPLNCGPSEVRATIRANLGRPLINLLLTLGTLTKNPDGVVIGFQNFAWATNSQTY